MQNAHHRYYAILILVSFDHFEHQKLIINFHLPKTFDEIISSFVLLGYTEKIGNLAHALAGFEMVNFNNIGIDMNQVI
ncbi:hypothetical protein BpHYR1_043931 [Brachionus plicatilis]|uniref:Uncharacterized protein n=1 Tax=Brachionus plicatilis TaxID=10195 RepID=A0A3M7RK18_BRAPC|nr:hypothetical protein BpHYR1_043931 [Brachionus plicatilis]